MFDRPPKVATPAPTASPTVSSTDVRGWVADLIRLDPEVGDWERVEQLRVLEELKAAAAAAQVRVTVDFDASQREVQRDAGVPARDLGKGIAGQVALARRDSPVKGGRHLALAVALVHEMPHTLAALERGQVSEWRATLVVRETAGLSRVDRMVVDAELASRPGGLGALGDAATAVEARRIAYRLDPYAFTARARKVEAERRVTLRPAPDTMTHLTGLLPVRQGVAVYASLGRHADQLRSSGDRRSRGQIMADTLVERVTGQVAAGAVPVEVTLVMDEGSLTGTDDAPAFLERYGPVPAPLARQWLLDLPEDVSCWVRRLFTSPTSGQLVALDTTRRLFTGLLRRFLVLRDQTCRTPWCDAPIRQVDHVRPAADGGPTSAVNGQGLCEACNHTKQASGWSALVGPATAKGRTAGVIETLTPTGHRYKSLPPPPPGRTRHPDPPMSRAEISFHNMILTA